MTNKDFQLNEDASFIFSYNNTMYKTTINITEGIIILEELNKDNNKKNILSVISIPHNNTIIKT